MTTIKKNKRISPTLSTKAALIQNKVKGKAKKVPKKHPVALCIHGWGVEIEYIAVDETAFKRLVVDGVTSGVEDNEFDKYLRDATTLTGALNGHCGLYVGDVALRKKIRLKPTGAKNRIGGKAKYLLVNLSSVKGDIRSINIDGDFDKELLELDLNSYEFSDGTCFELVWLDYGSAETYDCDISCKAVESFVLTRDGKRHPVIFKDQ